MAHTVFDQDIFIAASPEIVREFLANLMTNIEELHPLVISKQHIKSTAAPDGTPVEHYLVRDRMKLGPLTTKFSYRADMHVAPDGKLTSNAYQSPGIHLAHTTWCEPEGNGTRVREHIEITAPRLLMKITYNGAASAHKTMFEKLKRVAETAQAGLATSTGEGV